MRTLLCLTAVFVLFRGIVKAEDSDTPRTLYDLNQWYVEPPVSQNAATYFLQGFAELNVSDSDYDSTNLPYVGKASLTITDRPLPDEMRVAISKFMNRNQKIWPFFERGTECDRSRYPLDLTQGYEVKLRHAARVKLATMVCSLFALGLADEGHGEKAGDHLLTGLALARSLEAEPVLISQLVRVSCVVDVTEGLEQVLNRTQLPVEILNQLQGVLDQMQQREGAGISFKRSLVGERIIGLSFFDLPPKEFSDALNLYLYTGSHTTFEQLRKTVNVAQKNLQRDRQFFDETLKLILTGWEQEHPRRLAVTNILGSRLIDAKNQQFILTHMLLEGGEKAVVYEGEGLAYLRLAQTAVALERFRVAHDNHYPEYLSELAPIYLTSVPTDPFDGQRLRYSRNGSGYRLYSIGQDQIDHSGKRKDGLGGDIVFEVIERKAARGTRRGQEGVRDEWRLVKGLIFWGERFMDFCGICCGAGFLSSHDAAG